MKAPILEVCAASAAVTALIGSNPVRLYLFGEASQNTTKPYAVWQTIGGSPENYLKTLPDADSYTLQVDAYAASAADVRAVAKALRNAIEPRAYVTSWSGEYKDPETNLYRFSFTVDWIVQR